MGAPSCEVKVKAPSCEVSLGFGCEVKAPSCECEVSCEIKAPSCEVKVKAPSCEVSLGFGGGMKMKAPSCEVECEVSCEIKAPSCECEVSCEIKAPSCEVSCDIECDVEIDVSVEVNAEATEGEVVDGTFIATCTNIPEGCNDYASNEDGELTLSEDREVQGDWRCAGSTVMEFGFELTQDEPSAQQGHVLCRVPFDTKGSELHAHLDYVVEADNVDSLGCGFCIYLVDPSVPGWDRLFDGGGPLGFDGKTGALLGVGIDLDGAFGGEPNHVVIKSASGEQLTAAPISCDRCTPMLADEDDPDEEVPEWRKVKIRLDIESNTCDVKVGGETVIEGFHLEGITIPSNVCIGVCGATSGESTGHLCVNDIVLIDEDEDDG